MGNVAVLITEQDSWQTLVDGLALVSDGFMADRQQPLAQPREDLIE